MTPSGLPCRWCRLSPGLCLGALLVVEGFLWVSQRFHWFAFNEHKSWTALICVAGVAAFLLLMFLWFLGALLFCWRFQYNLLSLLVLAVAVALPFAWLGRNMAAAGAQREVVGDIREFGGVVVYDYQAGRFDTRSKPPAPLWLRRLLGDDLFRGVKTVYACSLPGTGPALQWSIRGRVVSPATSGDFVLDRVTGLSDLRELDLSFAPATDAGLENLRLLKGLRKLDLSGSHVTSAGLKNLEWLTHLENLLLCDTEVTDAGLKHLEGLTQLRELNLAGTVIGDAGLEHLTGLTSLRTVRLYTGPEATDQGARRLCGTDLTYQGVRRLREALPKCKILYNRQVIGGAEPN